MGIGVASHFSFWQGISRQGKNAGLLKFCNFLYLHGVARSVKAFFDRAWHGKSTVKWGEQNDESYSLEKSDCVYEVV